MVTTYTERAKKYAGQLTVIKKIHAKIVERDRLFSELKLSVCHDLMKMVVAALHRARPGSLFNLVHCQSRALLGPFPQYRTKGLEGCRYEPGSLAHKFYRDDREIVQWIEPVIPIIGYWMIERGTHDAKKMHFLAGYDGEVFFLARSGRLHRLPESESELLALLGWPVTTPAVV